ncbi:bifunctional diaminohydroxyphosphoribosylaminopyrimidine deaminase/5-amino-6-(5-phosphoribosylamino)uracil reductase RibD [Hirschia litorea]|uniref:Bifunctional diaminohydroxyphosphoribosylaminopyrimidine deaminase/5-amino-6-(5-phosphoribosylamino)uracil reductase RibD n=1 Tax=Hirschia litorea TaxID=1199156 RepID=A0ABW2IM79_9PROT
MSSIETELSDLAFMQRAIKIARTNLGKTAPNPSVGCVIMRGGDVLAEACTGAGGRPHAEQLALASLEGQDLSEAVAYVTLEPCHSRSNGEAGCSDRLLHSGIKRVVVAELDPHPTANGGVNKLRDAGIQVDVGIGAQDAKILTAGFFKRMLTGWPLVSETDNRESYDGQFLVEKDESLHQALMRFGDAGHNRLWVSKHSEIAQALKAANLLDEIQE